MDGAFKVSIIGAGNVGATIAYSLLISGLPTDLTLIDIDRARAEGLILDFEHSLPFTSFARLVASNEIRDAAGSHLVIVAAGRKQLPGQTRLDLASLNKEIIAAILKDIAVAVPDALVLIVTNPVDVMTLHALKQRAFAPQKLFGSGTTLDTARFRFHLSQKLGIHPRSIAAYIMGEHGDSAFPVLSSANVMGKPLLSFAELGRDGALECFEKARAAAYRIINDIGFTAYSIATAVTHMVRAIKEDTREVFMLSTLLDDYHGNSGICLSVPCALGRSGIVKQIEIPLDAAEKKLLEKSVAAVRAYC